MKVIVLGGGNSVERDVSLRSSAAIAKGLTEAGFEVEQIDTKNGLNFFDSVSPSDIIFPILHGAEGEDGVIQKEMESRNLAFLGSGSKASALCFDKGAARKMMVEAGIVMPNGASITKEQYVTHPLTAKPHVLKAQRGGSSIGTYLVHDPMIVDKTKINEVFELDNLAIIEELIVGVEITVSVLDGVSLLVIEIVPPQDGEFDYENKYNGKSQELCPAVSLNKEAQLQAQKIAEQVYALLECRHLGRVDIMVGKDGKMFVLEMNTMPGMTNQSLFPISARVGGFTMPQLTKKLVDLVKRDYGL